MIEGQHRVPAVNIDWITPKYLRRERANNDSLSPGTIHVDTKSKHLRFARDRDTIIEYGVTVGADAFLWSGEGYIDHIRAWPSWTPTPRMMREDPMLKQFSGGMPGGEGNPLGARALYIYQNGRDTLFRIHGTHATWRIGQNYSSGCIRMLNQDVIELAELVPPKAHIHVV